MTHLTTSETLIAVGRPDGRMSSLAATEAATIMSMQQAKFIKQSRTGIEAFSIGHNPWTNPRLFTRHIALPQSARPVFMSETMLHDLQEDPELRFAACHPEECLHKFAALREDARGNLRQIPKLSLSTLKEHLGSRTSISRAEARELIKDILEDQQDELGIRAEDVPIAELLPTNDDEKWSSRRSKRSNSKLDLSSRSSDTGGSEAEEPHKRRFTSLFQSPVKMYAAAERSKPPGRTQIAITDILTLIRSSEMRRLISVAYKKVQREQFLRSIFSSQSDDDLDFVQKVFMNWKSLVCVHSRKGVVKVQHPGDWRQLEAFRSAVLANSLSTVAWGVPLRNMFLAWWDLTLRSDMVRERYYVAGSANSNTLDAAEVLDKQVLCEHLYETRVAAQERLIAFFVLFHRMVKPISRVPFLGFDMDRTESRLRVASTPAPVAMRAKLDDMDDTNAENSKLVPSTNTHVNGNGSTGDYGNTCFDASEFSRFGL
eukprot:TRINITY_DN7133_c0_g2_i1.p1 TRINITY_DN7133_c0_g2~~TRINITY_DN7133_c0_g2_i1.p1  ORF type:complete len:525 (+),score=60.57 TRINITY_DN7133_c0_g2_i1:120-1577(+)